MNLPLGDPEDRLIVAGDHRPVAYTLAEGPDIDLPHGFGSGKTWAFAVHLLSAVLGAERLAELVDGTAIIGYGNGEVTIQAKNAVQADRLAGEYRDLIARKLGEAMRRPVRIAVTIPEPPSDPHPSTPDRDEHDLSAFDPEPEVITFLVAECGLPSPQVWAAVLDEVTRAGDVSRANVDTWLRSSQLIGRAEDGRLIVGAAHALAQRRIASRFAQPLQAAAVTILGRAVGLEIVVTGDWLRHDLRVGRPTAPGPVGSSELTA